MNQMTKKPTSEPQPVAQTAGPQRDQAVTRPVNPDRAVKQRDGLAPFQTVRQPGDADQTQIPQGAGNPTVRRQDEGSKPIRQLMEGSQSARQVPGGTEARQRQQQTQSATPATKDRPALPATQRDLIELHKRFVAMFSTLNQGLAETATAKAAEDRAALAAKLDHMEEAINSLEGMLRIEMTPQIRTVVREELAAQKDTTQTQLKRLLAPSGVILGAILLGAAFPQEIGTVTGFVSAQLGQVFELFVTIWGHLAGAESV